MKTELFIARKLRLAPSDGGRRSPAVGIAVGGVALAVAVMMVSIAIVVGFQDAIRQKVAGFEASVTLRPLGRYYQNESTTIRLSDAMKDAIAEVAPDAEVSLSIAQPVVLKTTDGFAGLVIHAYDEAHDMSFETSNMLEGTLPQKATDLTISQLTASRLSLKVGDKVDGCFFIDDALKLRRFTVCGIYSSNFGDYDRLIGYADFAMMQKLRKLDADYGDEVLIRNVPLADVAEVTAELQESLNKRYQTCELIDGVSVSTILDAGAMYFNWLALLDANVVVILIIMSLISGFTLITCVFILILQRVKMIGVLKSLGATNGQIRRVFMLLGSRVVGLGLLIGNVVGLGLLLIQYHFHLMTLDPDAYFLSYVPVLIDWHHIVLLNICAIVLAAILMLMPASIIGRISPAKTMHYE